MQGGDWFIIFTYFQNSTMRGFHFVAADLCDYNNDNHYTCKSKTPKEIQMYKNKIHLYFLGV